MRGGWRKVGGHDMKVENFVRERGHNMEVEKFVREREGVIISKSMFWQPFK